MQIKRFTLVNFRGIEKIELEFKERTTALVGVNGVGKSSILDALAITLSNMTSRICGVAAKSRTISKDDIRIGADYTRLSVVSNWNNEHESVEWAIARNRKAGKHPEARSSDLQHLNRAASNLRFEISKFEFYNDHGISLPLAVYYDVHRAVLDVPLRVREQLKNVIDEGYDDALDHGGADFKRFFIWFRNQEDIENEIRSDTSEYRDPQLSAVRQAIEVFTGFRSVRIKRKGGLRMTVLKDQRELNVSQLSDGEKCLLAMVGDLARRLTLLNRDVKDPLEGAGIVLIDELDLHLHPGWQRSVVANLEKTFPNCQFIITTHSPQILGELPATAVMLLKNGDYIGHPERSLGLSSGEVLEELMGDRAQSVTASNPLGFIRRLLDDDKFDEAQAELDVLRHKVGDIPDVLEIQSSIDSLRWIEEDHS